MDTYDIENAEIFATGEHNGDTYTAQDLDDMVDAAGKVGFTPAVKLGHDETPGRPAYGYVENLRRVGTKLVADLTNIPREIYDVIKRRGYDRLSAEVYWNLKSGGKTFRRALKALALLGSEVPAITSLAPLHTLFANCYGDVREYTIDIGRGDAVSYYHKTGAYQMKETLKRMSLEEAQQTAGEILDSKAQLLMEKFDAPTYAEAFARVKTDPANAFLFELYSGVAAPDTPVDMSPEEAGQKIAAHALRIARAENVPLHQANVLAVQRYPDLAAKYEQISTHAKYRRPG